LLKLVAPTSRGYVTRYHGSGDGLALMTTVGKEMPLSELAPRVKGRISFESVTDRSGRRVLEVTTNFVWVYPFADGHTGLIHDRVRWRFYRAGDVQPPYRGLQPYRWRAYWYNVDCAATAHGILAPRTTLPAPTGNPDSYYNPDRAVNIPENC
jgi:hypothetical protein